MKKILLTLLTISFFAANSFAQQEWTKIFNEDDIMVEMATVECNPFDRMVPYSYVILRYTNKTGDVLDFNFELKLWYNNILIDQTPIDAGDFPVLKNIQLQPNQSIEGDCSSEMNYLRVYANSNNPKMPNELTRIEIEAK